MILSEGLGVEYDDLVSISMTGWLGQISELFFLHQFYFHSLFSFFWITFGNVMKLFTVPPKKASALISTLMEISRAYDLKVE